MDVVIDESDIVVDEHGVAMVVDDGGEIIVDYAVVDCAPAGGHRCADDVSSRYTSSAAMDTKVQTHQRPMGPHSIQSVSPMPPFTFLPSESPRQIFPAKPTLSPPVNQSAFLQPALPSLSLFFPPMPLFPPSLSDLKPTLDPSPSINSRTQALPDQSHQTFVATTPSPPTESQPTDDVAQAAGMHGGADTPLVLALDMDVFRRMGVCGCSG
jgi:hypothetical protein